jgi:hypothetical protein
MKMWQTLDKHCLDCHGKGEVECGQWRDGEYWLAFATCHCVAYHHDDEMKAFLATRFPDDVSAATERNDG